MAAPNPVPVEPDDPEDAATGLGGRVMMLLDPCWQPSGKDTPPPPESVMGGWYFDENGDIESFRANPGYRPLRPDSPTDPVDAAIQVVVRGIEGSAGLLADLPAIMRDARFGVAVDATGVAIVAPAPDGVPALLVTTAPAHRARCAVAGWQEAGLAELAAALPEQGVDVLFNPGAPASIRVRAAELRELANAR